MPTEEVAKREELMAVLATSIGMKTVEAMRSYSRME